MNLFCESGPSSDGGCRFLQTRCCNCAGVANDVNDAEIRKRLKQRFHGVHGRSYDVGNAQVVSTTYSRQLESAGIIYLRKETR